MVLGQVHCEVVSSQIVLDGVQLRDTRTHQWSFPVIGWGAVRIILAARHIDIYSWWLETAHRMREQQRPATYVTTALGFFSTA